MRSDKADYAASLHSAATNNDSHSRPDNPTRVKWTLPLLAALERPVAEVPRREGKQRSICDWIEASEISQEFTRKLNKK